MNDAFEVARNVSAPLALVGLISAVLLFILLQVIKSVGNARKPDQEQDELPKQIITRMFIVALVGMCLGFAGYVWISGIPVKPKDANSNMPEKKMRFNGLLLINQHPKDNVIVTELTSDEKTVTNSFGEFLLDKIDTTVCDSLILWFQASNLDTVARYSKHNIPSNFSFADNTVPIAFYPARLSHTIDSSQPDTLAATSNEGEKSTALTSKVYPSFITEKTAENEKLFKQYKERITIPQYQQAR